MLPDNPYINRDSEYYDFHRKNEEKIKYLIKKCKDDQNVRYVITGLYGEELKNKPEWYILTIDMTRKPWTKLLCCINCKNTN